MRLRTMVAEHPVTPMLPAADSELDDSVQSSGETSEDPGQLSDADINDIYSPPKISESDAEQSNPQIVASYDDLPDPNVSEELYWAEVKLAGAMADVERKRSDLEDQIGSAKTEVAAVQANLNQHEATLHNLREQLKSQTDILLGLARKLMRVTTGKQLPTEDDDSESKLEDGWRLVKTAELMKGIKGLSEKKLERLAEQAATAGDLEDLRATASIKHVSYHKVLPKGIGDGVTQLIEDRLGDLIITWSKKTQDPARVKLADDLVAELRDVANEWNQDDCVPKDSDDEHIHAGYSAFNEGRSYTEFISDDRAKSRQWMTGWVGAERLKQLSA
jgi:hypothetical protein